MAHERKILVVDDDTRLTSLLDEYFTRRGFTVLTAKSGREALERVEKDRPALVLLDIRMPGMDGVEVLRQIKARAPQVEIIVITALKDRALASKSLALGARDYVTKPVDLAYLERLIFTQLPAPALTPPAEAPRAAEAVGVPGAASTAPVAPPRLTPEVDAGAALVEMLSQSRAAPAPPVETAEGPTVLSVDVDPVVTLAAECFRLAEGLAPARLARETEECAVEFLNAVTVGNDPAPCVRLLRLCLQVAAALDGLAADELARIEPLCRRVEAGR
jgi:CheY-like chemotaxis protein